jgi:hypothetical protein
MKLKLAIGLAAITLTHAVTAATIPTAQYCTIPYLYATNIRPACEQYGSQGMAGLYQSNSAIMTMLNAREKLALSMH